MDAPTSPRGTRSIPTTITAEAAAAAPSRTAAAGLGGALIPRRCAHWWRAPQGSRDGPAMPTNAGSRSSGGGVLERRRDAEVSGRVPSSAPSCVSVTSQRPRSSRRPVSRPSRIRRRIVCGDTPSRLAASGAETSTDGIGSGSGGQSRVNEDRFSTWLSVPLPRVERVTTRVVGLTPGWCGAADGAPTTRALTMG
jgi:hypothetical protein